MQQSLLDQALSLAVLQCNIPAVELLLSWGADPRVVLSPKVCACVVGECVGEPALTTIAVAPLPQEAAEPEENELLKPEYQTDDFSMYTFKVWRSVHTGDDPLLADTLCLPRVIFAGLRSHGCCSW